MTIELLELRNLRLGRALNTAGLSLARLLTVTHAIAALTDHLARLMLYSSVCAAVLARQRRLVRLADSERRRVLLPHVARGSARLMAALALELRALTRLRLAVWITLRSTAGSLRLTRACQVQR